jgi:alginate O-acetyltransferase complex protein AlgI
LFLPAAYLAALAARRRIAVQNALLVVASVVFYSWSEPAYAVLMLLSVFANYCFALNIGKRRLQAFGRGAGDGGRQAEGGTRAAGDSPAASAGGGPAAGSGDGFAAGAVGQGTEIPGMGRPGARTQGMRTSSGAGRPAAGTQDMGKPGTGTPGAGRGALIAAVAFNICLLCVFKYADFAISSVNGLLGVSIPLPRIPLPVGISFFTFQAMSYVIDVYRSDVSPQRSFMKLLLYISFFPQLIAGPIIRYRDIERALSERSVAIEDAAYGVRRFIFGLSKKLLIANAVGQIADSAFAMDARALSLPAAWIGVIAYALQIYFDFSGYSDMAIGLGRMMGFKFQENFRYPYAATGIRDFWRRWHITLSMWFREYVYIPLGGNRKGKLREGANKLAVFLMTGLWHGANWTFVAWGAFHGLFIMLETYGIVRLKKLPAWLARTYTMLIVTTGFVIFRSESVGHAASVLASMFALSGTAFAGGPAQWLAPILPMLKPSNVLALAVAVILSGPAAQAVRGKLGGEWAAQPGDSHAAGGAAAAGHSGALGKNHVSGGSREAEDSHAPGKSRADNAPRRGKAAAQAAGFALSLAMLFACFMSLASSGYNPFIYFRF